MSKSIESRPPDWNTQVRSARPVPWDKENWGVAVDFEDGFRLTYPVSSQEAAIRHCDKVSTDPEFAFKVRWGQQ